MKTQLAMIAHAMCDGGTLSAAEAYSRYGCFRLSARVHDLRGMGFHVNTTNVTTKTRGTTKTFAVYHIPKAFRREAKRIYKTKFGKAAK